MCSKTVKLIQANIFNALSEYEKIKANLTKKTLNETNSNEANSNLLRFASILCLVNEVHSKIQEETFELVLFKNFIGTLSIKNILSELLLKN